MKWSNVAAWLLSIASLAFAADPKLAKNLDGADPRKAVDIRAVSRHLQFKHIPKGACVPASFMLSNIPFSHYRNTTATSLSPHKRGSTSASGNTLLANALWGSSTIAGFNLSKQGEK